MTHDFKNTNISCSSSLFRVYNKRTRYSPPSLDDSALLAGPGHHCILVLPLGTTIFFVFGGSFGS
jgi:hypothetical protein